MTAYPEEARLDALHRLNLLDTAPSESFDRITRMASQLFDLPIAAVSLTDHDRQWFKSRVGVAHVSIPRDKAPCAAVAESAEPLLIPDLLDDACYADSVLARQGVLVVDEAKAEEAFIHCTKTRIAPGTAKVGVTGTTSRLGIVEALEHVAGRAEPVQPLALIIGSAVLWEAGVRACRIGQLVDPVAAILFRQQPAAERFARTIGLLRHHGRRTGCIPERQAGSRLAGSSGYVSTAC